MDAAFGREELLRSLSVSLNDLLTKHSPGRNRVVPNSSIGPETAAVDLLFRGSQLLAAHLSHLVGQHDYYVDEAASAMPHDRVRELLFDAQCRSRTLDWPALGERIDLFERVRGLLTSEPPLESHSRFLTGWQERVRDHFLEKAQVTTEALRFQTGWSDTCWRAIGSARSLCLPSWSTSLITLFLSRTTRAIWLALQLGERQLAVTLRGQYLAAFRSGLRQRPRKSHYQRHRVPTHLWPLIGQELGRRHAGTIGLGPEGPPVLPSRAARVFDIALVYRDGGIEEWESFAEGYGSVAAHENARALQDIQPKELAAAGSRPREYAGIEDNEDPPAFIVQACTFALRNDEEIVSALRERHRRLEKDDDPSSRVSSAATLARDSADVDNTTMRAAIGTLFNTVQTLYLEKKFASVGIAIASVKLDLAGILGGPELAMLEGIELLALTQERPRPGQCLDACVRLLDTHQPQPMMVAFQHLHTLLQQPLSISERRKALSLTISIMVSMTMLTQDARHLRALLDVLSLEASKPGLDHGTHMLLRAATSAVSTVLASTTGSTPAQQLQAIVVARRCSELAPLLDPLLASRRRRTDCAHPDFGDVHRLPPSVSQSTREALVNEEWDSLATHVRHDLAALTGASTEVEVRLCLVGYLALALRMSVQAGASNGLQAAEEVLSLLAEIGGYFLEAAANSEWMRHGFDSWACGACELSLAGLFLFQFLPTGSTEFPLAAITLLEQVLDSTPRDLKPVRYATCLHDLAHAYQQYASYAPAEQRTGYLEHAATLFRENLVAYRDLRTKPAYLLAMHNRPRHIDYLNLGKAYLALAQASPAEDTYTSALYIREALCVLAMARDVSLETQHSREAHHAQILLSGLAAEIALACLEHTRANKGALKGYFHDWLCAIEGYALSTWNFATRYASFGLAQAKSAINLSLRPADEGLLWTSLRAAFNVWRVAELRHGVTGAPIMMDDNWDNLQEFRQRALVSIEDVLARMVAEPAQGLEALLPEALDYQRYFAGRMSLALFDLSGQEDDLLSATSRFEALSADGEMIPRALARAYVDWFRVSRHDHRLAANGLVLGAGAKGLEISVLSQRRAFTVGGLDIRAMAVDTRESSWIKTRSVGVIANSHPQIDWSGVPAFVPVHVGVCRRGARDIQILVVRVPTASWDTWVVHLGSDEEGALELDFPFPQIAGSEPCMGAEATDGRTAPTVTVGEATLLIQVRLGQKDVGTLQVTPRVGGTRVLSTGAKDLTISLRTTPTIVDAGVTVLARCDHPVVGACGAAMFNLASPSPSIPVSLIRAYTSLHLFEEDIDLRFLDQLRASAVRQLFLVGLPTSSGALERVLESFFDPRVELQVLVSGAERPIITAAIATLKARINASLGEPLYAIAQSLDDGLEGITGLQVIEVARELVPAAIQILLDLAAYRRLPLEDIPTGSPDSPFPVQLLGDPIGHRRARAALPEMAHWNDLTTRYLELLEAPELKTYGDMNNENSRVLFTLMNAPLDRRPLFIVPVDAPAIVLACTPYARHLGAILLPDNEEVAQFVINAKPAEIHVVEGCAATAEGARETILPRDPTEIALSFSRLAHHDHEVRTAFLPDGISSRLIAEMRPSAYVVIASTSAHEFWAASLAANYAAALGSPLLLFDDAELFSSEARTRTRMLLSGRSIREGRGFDSARHLLAHDGDSFPRPVAPLARALQGCLEQMNPTYVGVVSSGLTVPLELIGEPPLAVRYAFGRLCAPDLTSLSLLISAAALSEEIGREPTVRVLIAEAADAVAERPLPGARREGIHLSRSLSRSADLSVRLTTGDEDLHEFLLESREAGIIHFAGHGAYDDANPDDSALVFRGGRLRAADVPSPLYGSPIVYSNACESGVGHPTDELKSWSGLAAAFIRAGAVNYIGSLWPIFDDSSLRVAEQFYSLLNAGHTTGEALRRSKLDAFEAGDPIWAALVQFGCPRNRLRTGSAAEVSTALLIESDTGPVASVQALQQTSQSDLHERQGPRSRGASAPADAEKAHALFLSARRHSDLGDFLRSERELRRACELNPAAPQYAVDLGDALCCQDRWLEALGWLRSREVQFAGSWQIHESLGRVYSQIGQYDESRVAFEKALAFKPTGAALIRARLGTSLRKLGDLPAAERQLRLSYAEAPDDRLVNLFLLQLYKVKMLTLATAGEEVALAALNQEADSIIEHATQAGILNADLLVVKSQLRLILGRQHEAFEILELARQLDPQHPMVEAVYEPLKAELASQKPS